MLGESWKWQPSLGQQEAVCDQALARADVGCSSRGGHRLFARWALPIWPMGGAAFNPEVHLLGIYGWFGAYECLRDCAGQQ